MPERVEVTENRPIELRCKVAGRPFPTGMQLLLFICWSIKKTFLPIAPPSTFLQSSLFSFCPISTFSFFDPSLFSLFLFHFYFLYFVHFYFLFFVHFSQFRFYFFSTLCTPSQPSSELVQERRPVESGWAYQDHLWGGSAPVAARRAGRRRCRHVHLCDAERAGCRTVRLLLAGATWTSCRRRDCASCWRTLAGCVHFTLDSLYYLKLGICLLGLGISEIGY